MPSTIGTAVLNALYNVRLRQRDALAEELNKNFKVANTGLAGNLQSALRAYEGLSQAGIVNASASIDAAYTDPSVTIGTAGMFPKIGDMLVLAFSRTHPNVTSRIVTKEFVILAPHPDIYDTTTKKPVIVEGETFATAATRPESLGALIAWLEASLIIEVEGEAPTVGGFEFDLINSRLIGAPKTYDGNPVS